MRIALFKNSALLPAFLIFSVVVVTVPFRASAQQFGTIQQAGYVGTFQIPNSSVLANYNQTLSQTGAYRGTEYFSNGPSLVQQGSGLPRTLLQKYYSYSISNNVNSMVMASNNASIYYNPDVPWLNNCSKINSYYDYSNEFSLGSGAADESGNNYILPGCLPVVTEANSQNTQFVNNGSAVIQAVIVPVLTLTELVKRTTIEDIPGNAISVKKTTTANGTVEVYGIRFQRYGQVSNVSNGNWTGYIPGDSIYLNGKTYWITWQTDFGGRIKQCDPEYGCIFSDGASLGISHPTMIQLSHDSEPATKIEEVPRDSAIADVSKPACTSGSSDGFWKSRAWVDCVTFGHSDDARVGVAYYHDEQSGRGWFFSLAGFVITVVGIASGFGDFGLGSILTESAGFTGTLGGSAISAASALSTVQLGQQVAAITIGTVINAANPPPGIFGNVEAANNLGVGNWTWSPLLSPPAPSCSISATPNPITNGSSTVLSWTTNNTTSASIDQGVGNAAVPSGTKTVSPTTSTAYTMTVTGTGGTGTCTANVTVGSAPAAPTGLSASCPVPGNSGTVSWNAVPGATSYALRVDNTTKNGWNGLCDGAQNQFDVCGNMNGTSLTGATVPNDSYNWWVHACNATGCGLAATGQSFTCNSGPVDACPNIAGVQTSVPSGMVVNSSGNCVTGLPPIDVCQNIAGVQLSVPAGMTVNSSGNCAASSGCNGGICSNNPVINSCSTGNSTNPIVPGCNAVIASLQQQTSDCNASNAAEAASATAACSSATAALTACSAVTSTNCSTQSAAAATACISPSLADCGVYLQGRCTDPNATNCNGSLGSCTYLPPPPNCNLATNACQVVQQGTPATLNWTASSANSCSINGGGVNANGGSTSVSPNTTTAYQLTCSNTGGSCSSGVNIVVFELPVCTFSASPSRIIPPQQSTLSWNCTKSVSCWIDNNIGNAILPSGSKIVRPDNTTTYTIHCLGAGNGVIQAQADFQTTLEVTNFDIHETVPQ